MNKKQEIVVLGAGFGGVNAALELSKSFDSDRANITLIDRHDYHLFTTNLYEVAASEEELTTIGQMARSICLPLAEIFKNRSVNLLKAEVTNINLREKTVTAGIKKIHFDYLVTGAGSVSDYYSIAGAEKFALPLKSLKDALSIRNQIEFAVQSHQMDVKKKYVRIAVAGGGYTGVEVASELNSLLDILSLKYNYPRRDIEVVIIEATSELIPGLSARLSKDAYQRLSDLGVRILLSSPISKIDEHFLEFSNSERMEYDVLIWTTGVRTASLPFSENLETDKKGRIVVNEFLQAKGFDYVFAVGDGASVTNRDGKLAPPTAQDAIAQGKYAGYALSRILQNQSPEKYLGKPHGYIVSMGGKWDILNYGGFYFKGYFGYIMRQLANINYFRYLVGWFRAIKYVLFQMRVYGRND